MGLFDKLSKILKLKKETMTILVVGLNNSGKSTIINRFKNTDERNSITVPTVGFSIEKFQSKSKRWKTFFLIWKLFSDHGVNFTALDMSGAGRYRNLWQHHFKTCQGIVYVIDSSDRMRLVVVKDELEILLKHPDLEHKRIPILFYANKMDFVDALSSVKIAAALGLEKIDDKPWHISSSNAVSGEGLEEGVQWLIEQIRICVVDAKKKRNKNND